MKGVLVFAILALTAGGVSYGVYQNESQESTATPVDSSPERESDGFRTPSDLPDAQDNESAGSDSYDLGSPSPANTESDETTEDCNDASLATYDDYRCGSTDTGPYESPCNPASYATYDDYRCGGTGSDEYTEGCNPASYATYDDYRCGGTGSDEATEDCNPASYATYDDYRCGGTGSDEATEGCNPASYATYDDYRCGGN